jgi:hypothetical protein
MSPTIGLIERGQYEHWALVALVLEHKDNVIPCSKLSIIDPVFTCCFSIVLHFGWVRYKDTSLQDVFVVILPQCECMVMKSRGQN